MSFLKSVAMISLLALGACATEMADEESGSTESRITGATTEGATLVTTARLNLRATPSTSGKILLTMPLGASVTALAANPKGEFYKVEYDGNEGWASGRYLKAESGAPVNVRAAEDEAEAPAPEPADEADFNGRKYSGVTMLWQGNWDFLIKCDSYSRKAGKVTFYCGPSESRSFVDDEAWIAVPSGMMSKKLCNTKARVCKGDACVVATVIERSVTANRWEGSTAVLEALGVSPSFKSCTSSQGTATGVTVTLE
ncbi:MAG: SH3 domain-containing protein [Labilithrix sp.]|nr:SH3 domain-containing protein [Labilithrix sp.]MCW5812192.1 SH3 domain-containing protein [Labilithrix sp.]